MSVKGVGGLPDLFSRAWAVKLQIHHTLHASTICSHAATRCRRVKGVKGFDLCAPRAREKSCKPITPFTPPTPGADLERDPAYWADFRRRTR